MPYLLLIVISIGVAVNIVVSATNAKTAAARQFVIKSQIVCVLLAVALIVVPAILVMNRAWPMKVYLATAGLFFVILIPFELWSRQVIKKKSAL
jgi:heme/copper-type cytochrome/quinol oxidase subunit 4